MAYHFPVLMDKSNPINIDELQNDDLCSLNSWTELPNSNSIRNYSPVQLQESLKSSDLHEKHDQQSDIVYNGSLSSQNDVGIHHHTTDNSKVLQNNGTGIDDSSTFHAFSRPTDTPGPGSAFSVLLDDQDNSNKPCTCKTDTINIDGTCVEKNNYASKSSNDLEYICPHSKLKQERGKQKMNIKQDEKIENKTDSMENVKERYSTIGNKESESYQNPKNCVEKCSTSSDSSDGFEKIYSRKMKQKHNLLVDDLDEYYDFKDDDKTVMKESSIKKTNSVKESSFLPQMFRGKIFDSFQGSNSKSNVKTQTSEYSKQSPKQETLNKTSPRKVKSNSKKPDIPPPAYEPAFLDDPETDSGEKVKTKILSVWNNVKYGWTVKMKATFSDDKPLFLLGKCYHKKIDESASDSSRVSSIEQFYQDFSSRIWFTYRREFPQLEGSNFTTDCGWGCMLRSGQMVLAQALILHFLGREWRWYAPQTREQEAYHRQIVRWFGDFPSDQSPFSVHRLVRFGEKCLGKKAGDWYGPASVAHIMREAMKHAHEFNPILNITVYVAHDCTVFIQDVIRQCTDRRKSSSGRSSPPNEEEEKEFWRPLILLIPIRLGGEAINPIYVPCVKSLFSQDNCLGIIGGRPKHSLFFVGFQDDKLINLDPHFCQDVVETKARDFPLNTFHCMSPRKMPFARMDPSCTVGFYCRTRRDFERFVGQVKDIITPPMQKSNYPMFIFDNGSRTDAQMEHDNMFDSKQERYLRIRRVDQYGRVRTQSRESDDFVFL